MDGRARHPVPSTLPSPDPLQLLPAMAIREGRWDCPSCGSKAVYGRHVDCPGCGKPRPAGTRFYLTDDAPAITDAAQIAEARAGADWICGHCAATSRATQATCGGCGAARGDSPTQPVRSYAKGQEPRSGAAAAQSRTPSPAAGPPSPVTSRPPSPAALMGPPRRSYILHVIGAVFVALVGLIGWAAQAGDRANIAYVYTPPPLEPAVVEGMRWERRVVVEDRRFQPGAGWELPDSARVVASEERLVGHDRVVDHYVTRTRQVPRVHHVLVGYDTRTQRVSEEVYAGTRTYVCGTRDLGNGYFEDETCTEPEYETVWRTETVRVPRYRSETRMETVTDRTPIYRSVPRYRTWYSWNVPVWSGRFVTAQGDTTQPAWPEPALTADQRLTGERHESYYVTLRHPGRMEPFEVLVDSSAWKSVRVGQRVAWRSRYYGSVDFLSPDSLPACIQWRAGAAEAPSDSLGCTPPAPRDSAAAPADSTRPDSAAQPYP